MQGLMAVAVGVITTCSLLLIFGTIRSFGWMSRGIRWLHGEHQRWSGAWIERRRTERLGRELETELPTLARWARSGYLPLDLVRAGAHELESPLLRQVFRDALSRFQSGGGWDEALRRAHIEHPHPLFHQFISALEFARRTGADPGYSLGALEDIARTQQLLRGEVREETAEARYSALVVAGLPLVTVGYALLSRPELLRPLLDTATGRIALVYGVLSWVLGLVYLRWILVRAEAKCRW